MDVNGVYKPTNITGGASCMDCDNPQDIGEYTVESTRLLNTAQ